MRAYHPKGHEGLDQYGRPLTDEEVRFGRECRREAARLRKVTLTTDEILALARRLGYRLTDPPRAPRPPEGW